MCAGIMTTLPRMIRPNGIYAVARPLSQHRYLLRPDKEVNQMFRFLQSHYADKYDIRMIASVCMSTHYHQLVQAPHANISKFYEQLNHKLAIGINKIRPLWPLRWSRTVWEPGQLNITECVTAQAVIEAIAYIITNPVAAGAVHRPEDWPGFGMGVEDVGRMVVRERRPDWFSTNAEAFPEWAERAMVMPDRFGLGERDEEEVRALLRDEVDLQIRLARKELRDNGRRVMGARRCVIISPYRKSGNAERLARERDGSTGDKKSGNERGLKRNRKRGRGKPRVKAGRGQKEALIAALRERRIFRANYRAALKLWCGGDREVVFPPGTYRMRVLHRANTAPFPMEPFP